VKPAPFSYSRAASPNDVLATLREHGDTCRILAGGQSLLPQMNVRAVRPAMLIDIGGLSQLRFVRAADGNVSIGALSRHKDLEFSAELRRLCPLFALATPNIGDRQVRARGTLGGSLAFADPAAELPLLCVTLDAQIRVERADQRRIVPAAAFFKEAFRADLAADEMITQVDIASAPESSRSAFIEFSRRHADPALASAAVMVELDAKGAIRAARLGVGGASPMPRRASEVEQLLAGERCTAELLDEVEQRVRRFVDPISDLNGSAEYRRRLAGVAARRALETAARAS